MRACSPPFPSSPLSIADALIPQVYPLNCVAGQMSIPGGVRGNMLVACQAIYSKFGLGK